MVKCGPCTVGYHFECWEPLEDGSCHCTAVAEDAPVAFINNETDPPGNPREIKERGGQIKAAGKVKDLESTGRKRAALLYPIPKDGEPGYPMACEWQGLKFAGGGVLPIVGCVTGEAKNIHHGPDKNTLANFVGNVHRICPSCHNRWHTANDKYYPPTRPEGDVPYVPLEEYEWSKHDGVNRATEEEMAGSEIAWATSKAEAFLHSLKDNAVEIN